MFVKKSTFYLTGHEITLRSDHLPLKKFLRKMTLNNTVNNWSTEIESFNINSVHIAGKANVLADMLSRLIDTDPDLQQQPELEGHEFGKYCFETLPKARGSVSEVKIGSDTAEVCEIQITYGNPENLEFSVKLPLEDDKIASLQGNTPNIREIHQTGSIFLTGYSRVRYKNRIHRLFAGFGKNNVNTLENCQKEQRNGKNCHTSTENFRKFGTISVLLHTDREH